MLKLLRKFTPKEWILSVAAFVLILIQVWLTLTMPDYMSEITSLVQTEGSLMEDIFAAGGKMLLCALGSLLLAVAVGYFASRLAATLARRVREAVFEKVEGFSMEESIRRAKAYISGALRAGLDLGKGSGPMNHGYGIPEIEL